MAAAVFAAPTSSNERQQRWIVVVVGRGSLGSEEGQRQRWVGAAAAMGRGLQPDQPSGWEGEVPGAACVPLNLHQQDMQIIAPTPTLLSITWTL